jgi:hypothetical protein
LEASFPGNEMQGNKIFQHWWGYLFRLQISIGTIEDTKPLVDSIRNSSEEPGIWLDETGQ